MKKQILGFILLLSIACLIVTCTETLASDSQSTGPIQKSLRKEQSVVSHIEPKGTQVSSNPEKIEKAQSTPGAESNEECVIRLVSDTSPQFECARVYSRSGKVEYKQDRNSSTNFKDIRRLPKGLIDAEYNVIRTTGRGNSDLLFNTLDLIHMGDDAYLELEKGLDPNGTGITKERIFLNFGKLVVSNAVLQDSSSEDTASTNQSSKQASGRVGEEVSLQQRNFFQRLWHGARNSISRFRLALSPNNLFAQPAFANDFDSTLLDSPTLTVSTPEAEIASNGAVYVVQRSEDRTKVFSLTEQPIKIKDQAGKVHFISRNQTAVIDKIGFVEDPYEFKLCGFYRSNKDLINGLAPRDIPFVRQQSRPLQFAYHTARSLTVPLYHKNCQRRCAPKGSGA